MKEKIIAELKTAYAKLGLSDEAFDGVASLLEKTVTEESEIATAVGGDNVKNLLKTIQGQVDSWKNKYHDKAKELNSYKEKHPDTDPGKTDPDTKADDDEPAWAKRLREQNEAIAARFEAEDNAKKAAANLQAVEAKLKAAGCVNAGILRGVLKGFALGKDEDVDAATTRLQEEYNNSYKEIFGDGPQPGFGSGNFNPDPKANIDKMNDILRQEGLLPEKE